MCVCLGVSESRISHITFVCLVRRWCDECAHAIFMIRVKLRVRWLNQRVSANAPRFVCCCLNNAVQNACGNVMQRTLWPFYTNPNWDKLSAKLKCLYGRPHVIATVGVFECGRRQTLCTTTHSYWFIFIGQLRMRPRNTSTAHTIQSLCVTISLHRNERKCKSVYFIRSGKWLGGESISYQRVSLFVPFPQTGRGGREAAIITLCALEESDRLERKCPHTIWITNDANY